MSKKKGVSADEKKTRVLQIFYEKKEFFQLKDLEKIAPKEKGVIANSVKDVLQSLVDDGFVDTDKIGTSVYFWAFPSKAKNTRKRKLDELKDKYEQTAKKMKTTESTLQDVKLGEEESAQRDKYVENITDLQLQKDLLLSEVKKYKDNDPEILEKLKNETQMLKEAANRWTDNVFSVKSWCKKKFSFEDAVLDKQFGIPTDFDYLE